MIVDRDTDVLEKLSGYLLELLPKAEIHTFIDPFWAVKYAYGSRIDMIFTETEMLGLNGSTVIRLVRNRQKEDIPAFYVTESEELYRRCSHQICANGLLKKPITKENVKRLLAGIPEEWEYSMEERESAEL